MSGPMGLVYPTVGASTNVWGTVLDTLLGLVENHDHSSGKGVQVPSAGIGINADLTFASFAGTNLKALAFTEQAASSVTGYSDALFVNSTDRNLYFRNSGGTNVQITSGNTLDLSVAGAIGGDYATVGALLSYDDATHRYLFQQEGTPRPWAGAAMGNLDIYQQAASITNYVRIQSPNSLAAQYTMTLPTGLPARQIGLTLDNGGQIATKGGTLYLGVQEFPTSGTYTPTTGTTRVVIEAVGGGGGGGGVSTGASQSGAGGGGSGTYAIWTIGDGTTLITGGAVTIGAGGTAGDTTGSNGGAGGNTTVVINGTTYTAPGGSGGGGVSTSTGYGTGGATGGFATATNLKMSDGRNGDYGQGLFSSTHLFSVGGAGGGTRMGQGGATQFVFASASPYSLAGITPLTSGGGGSGACLVTGHSGTAEAGGSGAAGQVLIYEYM